MCCNLNVKFRHQKVNAFNRIRKLVNRREGNSIVTLSRLVSDTPNFCLSGLLSLETIEMRFLVGGRLILLCNGVRCPVHTAKNALYVALYCPDAYLQAVVKTAQNLQF